ncbi:putative pentatricopeptide repeat-containing protein At5g09950 [Nymphaea colorata]|uniref:DYW domain-containing protein n=1 Tax=Nymphaea colorata TaxID=210225 RepID=A0A5K0V9B1_9MAGN|nr:putative pentatricopeptide repeat-containing protein At5g09950 [Nymphaea colorata]
MHQRARIPGATAIHAYRIHRHYPSPATTLSRFRWASLYHSTPFTEESPLSSSTYSLLVEGCNTSASVSEARRHHLHAIRSGFDADIFLANSLVNVYVNVGCIEDARKLFDGMPQRNTVSWSCIISGHVRHGRPSEAVSLFSEMRREGFDPTHFALGSVLRACSQRRDRRLGEAVHGLVVKNGYALHTVVGNVLMGMYANCVSFDDAFTVFDEIPEKNMVSWNGIISTCSRFQENDLALELLSELRHMGMYPDEYTLGSLISCCQEHVEQILAYVVKSGHLGNVYVGSAVVSTYARFRQVAVARRIFDDMVEKNVVSINGLMVGYVKQSCWEETLEIFSRMRNLGFEMNTDSIVILLSACACGSEPSWGREVHAHVFRTGMQHETAIGNALVNMYAKCGAIHDARKVFKLMPKKDSISWNAMISGLDQNECYQESFETFLVMMRERLVPDNLTFVSTLSSCGNLTSVQSGQQIHSHIIKRGLDLDVSVGNSLLTMYASSGSINDSFKVFNRMVGRDQVSWNAMIGALADCEMATEALGCFLSMIHEGWTVNRVTFLNVLAALSLASVLESCRQVHALTLKNGLAKDNAIENALISSYAKCGEMNDAEQVFRRMSMRDVVSWNSMITGYTHNGLASKAMDIVGYMLLVGHQLDCFTCATVLSACAAVAALELGMQVHAYIIRSSFGADVVVESSLVDMYAKCGRVNYASRLFDLMDYRNEFSWNSMISGYARNGYGEEALELFKKMLQQSDKRPDHVTFVGVLSACSHVGLVDEGLEYFESMRSSYGLVPKMEHYSCIVDLLGRAGRVTKAEEIIRSMPMQPNSLIWRTLLGACCRTRGNIELGIQAAERLLELEPQNPVTYVLMSNMLASGGKWEEVTKVRTMMRGMKVKKEPGCSWVMMKDGVHLFVSGDSSHQDASVIYAKLEDLNLQMRNAGYVPQTEFALYDLEAEHKEQLLSYHSEKLALAFVLTRTTGKLPIRIMKNLRICGDCHSAFKIISQIIGRLIIVRDSNRFHHFDAGQCSCKDYW